MKIIILFFISLGLSNLSHAEGGIDSPYTLFGSPHCTLSVLDSGHETAPGFSNELGSVDTFFADVSVSAMPRIIFHLKTKNGRIYIAQDAISGLTLKLVGSGPSSKVPLSRGYFVLKRKKQTIGRCHRLMPMGKPPGKPHRPTKK